MDIITWFTQPVQSFASFYMYDKINGDFVRIRLELGRRSYEEDDGSTGIQVRKNMYIGFANENDDLKYSDENKWNVKKYPRQLFYDKELLTLEPKRDFFEYDSNGHIDFIHYGNPVTKVPILPKKDLSFSVDEKTLYVIAQNYLGKEENFYPLTKGNASQDDLISAIKKVYATIK